MEAASVEGTALGRCTDLAGGLLPLQKVIQFRHLQGLLDGLLGPPLGDTGPIRRRSGWQPYASRGGERVAYENRKKCRIANALYLTDRQGLPLVMLEPVAGNHHDLHEIEVQFEVVTAMLGAADIPAGEAIHEYRCWVRL